LVTATRFRGRKKPGVPAANPKNQRVLFSFLGGNMGKRITSAISFGLLFLLACVTAHAAIPPKPGTAAQARIVEGYGKLPLSFEANQGQTDAQVKFLSRGPGYSLFLTPTEAVLSLRKSSSSGDTKSKVCSPK
jgi:hypothetical protein